MEWLLLDDNYFWIQNFMSQSVQNIWNGGGNDAFILNYGIRINDLYDIIYCKFIAS